MSLPCKIASVQILWTVNLHYSRAVKLQIGNVEDNRKQLPPSAIFDSFAWQKNGPVRQWSSKLKESRGDSRVKDAEIVYSTKNAMNSSSFVWERTAGDLALEVSGDVNCFGEKNCENCKTAFTLSFEWCFINGLRKMEGCRAYSESCVVCIASILIDGFTKRAGFRYHVDSMFEGFFKSVFDERARYCDCPLFGRGGLGVEPENLSMYLELKSSD